MLWGWHVSISSQSTQMLMTDLFSATLSYENNIGKHPLEPIRASNLFSRQRKGSSGCSFVPLWFKAFVLFVTESGAGICRDK